MAAVAATAVAGVVTGCGSASSATGDGTLAIGTLVDVQSFDPALNPGQGQRLYLDPIYDSLLRTDADGKVVAGLATQYTLTPSSLDLTLPEGRVFSDGTPLDAQAVKESLEHIKSAAGPASTALASVSEVRVSDPAHVSLQLSAPAPALPIALTDVAGMVVAPSALDGNDLGSAPVGSGPYMLDPAASSKGVSYVYVQNPHYEDKTDQGLNRVEIKVLTDGAARAGALRSGQIDMAQVDRAQADAVSSAGMNVEFTSGNHWMLQLADIGGDKSPALANKDIRQAIGYAIDREAIVNASLFGQGTATTQVFGPESPFHVGTLPQQYRYDPEKARQLVARSGVQSPKFTVPAFGPTKPIAEAVQGYLRDVGIEMEIVLVQPGTLEKENRSTNFGGFLTPIKQVHPEQLYNERLAPNGPQNPFGTVAPTIDELHAAALAAPDEASRDVAYQKMLAEVADEALWIDLFTDQTPLAWNDKVQGVTLQPGWVMGPSLRGVTA
ncbi:ABC transporter substrate-binding protein [Prescottella subtropica]|uniref:ABC transporter substrate-binding protein n=1 Tax=Prescottella subtropica TaxID=2545757 RepID=UPI001386E999|nr:ABC transporter substrate-binding protein [Prescottella subtropica]